MNMLHIEYILTLAEEKNFSKAAEQLYMTQSALSQYVRKQEKQLGIPLFYRGNNSITPTPEGGLYVQTLQNMKTNMLDFHRQLADLTELRTGKLVIGTSNFFATHVLPSVIRQFTDIYPGIDLEVTTGSINHLKSDLSIGKIDFCIEHDSFEKTSFYCEPLYTETHYLAVSRSHPLNRSLNGSALTAEDIKNKSVQFSHAAPVSLQGCEIMHMVDVKPENIFYKCHTDMLHEANCKPRHMMLADTIETAFRWAETGIAIAIIPDSLIIHGNFGSHPYYYKLDLKNASQNVVFALQAKQQISAAAKKFIELFRTFTENK